MGTAYALTTSIYTQSDRERQRERERDTHTHRVWQGREMNALLN